MTAIHTPIPSLTLRAGKRALERLQQKNLEPGDIHVIPGAAGGPKGLGISGLDQAIFGDWLPRVKQERALVGASVGSWRFAAIASSDNPVAQLKKLAEMYTSQRFEKGMSAQEVTRSAIQFLDELLGGSEEHILQHPWYRLNIMVIRSLGLLAEETRSRLGLGLMGAVSANMLGRRHLARFMERVIVRDPRGNTPMSDLLDFTSHQIDLTRENLMPSLLASGSIPMIMSGVQDLPGGPAGVYRDGGLLDYHLDLPWQQPGIVLYPHFTDKIVPGWFDKTLPWRRGDRTRLQDVLLLAPSPEYLATLPDRKLPDRKDFEKYANDNTGREKAWRRAIAESDRLGDEFLELVETGRLLARVEPL